MFRIIEDLVFCFCCGPEFFRVCTHMKRQRVRACARVKIWGVHTGFVRASLRQIGMASYLLECGIIFIGIWHHKYWNVASHLLEYGIINIRMWHHNYWNVAS